MEFDRSSLKSEIETTLDGMNYMVSFKPEEKNNSQHLVKFIDCAASLQIIIKGTLNVVYVDVLYYPTRGHVTSNCLHS